MVVRTLEWLVMTVLVLGMISGGASAALSRDFLADHDTAFLTKLRATAATEGFHQSHRPGQPSTARRWTQPAFDCVPAALCDLIAATGCCDCSDTDELENLATGANYVPVRYARVNQRGDGRAPFSLLKPPRI